MSPRRPRAAAPRRRPRRAPAGPADTRDRLLDAAERLFAERGLQGISLRAINVAAGARNVAAAHYHFRSKDGLVRAVVARRMDALSNARLAALRAAEIAAGADRPPLRPLVEAIVLPTIGLLADASGGGTHYLRLLARAAADPDVDLEALATDAFRESSVLYLSLLGRALPGLPAQTLVRRALFGMELLLNGVLPAARFARTADGALNAPYLQGFAADLVDFVCAGLQAPAPADRARAVATRTAAGTTTADPFWGLTGLRPPTDPT